MSQNKWYTQTVFFERGQIKLLSIFKYIGTCLSYQKGKIHSSVQLKKSSPLWENTKQSLIQLLGALPCPKVMVFHCEFFVMPNNELIFCEIASRVGGSRIVETISKSHGVNLFKIWLRAQLGLPYATTGRVDKTNIFGFSTIPPKEGVIISIPEEPNCPWVSDIKINGKIGSKTDKPKSSTDALISFIVAAEDYSMLQVRLNQVIDYYNENLIYQ